MNTEKILGFVLLTVGVLIIFYAAYSSFAIFTGEKEAPEIFVVEEKVSLSTQPSFDVDSLQDLQEQIPDLLSKQLENLIPASTVPQMLNLAIWSMLAGILIFAGAQLAGLGIKLIKK